MNRGGKPLRYRRIGADPEADPLIRAYTLRQIRDLDEALVEYGQHLEALAVTPRYREAVQSLTCYKGIKNIFALTMITEIGDIKRFAHPRQLMSWSGTPVSRRTSQSAG